MQKVLQRYTNQTNDKVVLKAVLVFYAGTLCIQKYNNRVCNILFLQTGRHLSPEKRAH